MNEFDQFMKNTLKVRHYVRYTDDFVVVSKSFIYLEKLLKPIAEFLDQKLLLSLHPKKVTIRKFNQGIDFLGYLIFPKYRVVRTKTKKRIFSGLKRRVANYNSGKIEEQNLEQSFQSYLGVLSHANSYYLSNELKNRFWLRIIE